MKRLCLCLVFGWLHAHLIAAPEPRDGSRLFQLGHYSVRNGLASGFVYATAQDSRGFIWIATHDGLNRFDGYQFKTWRVTPGTDRRFPGSIITGIHIDARDRFWLVIRDSLWRFNPQTGACSKVDLPHAIINFKGFYPLDSNTVLVDAAHDLVLYPERGEAVAMSRDPVYALIPDREYKTEYSINPSGECYAAQLHPGYLQLWRYSPGRRAFADGIRIPLPVDGHALNAFLVDRQGQLHLSVQGFLPLRYLPNGGQPPKLQPGARDVVHYWEDRDGNIWMSSQSGLLCWDTRAKEEWLFRAQDAPGALRSDVVRQVRADRTGLLWIATGNGVHTLNPRQRQVKHLSADAPEGQRLLSDFILGLQAELQGTLWIQYFSKDQRSAFREGYPIRHTPLPAALGAISRPGGQAIFRPIASATFGVSLGDGQWWTIQGKTLQAPGSDSG